MKLFHFTPAIFATSALATTFIGFGDTACQAYNGSYVSVTKAELENIVKTRYEAQVPLIPEASRFFTNPGENKTCPSNSDDTYKWVSHARGDVGVAAD
jgi:hypothetical protein